MKSFRELFSNLVFSTSLDTLPSYLLADDTIRGVVSLMQPLAPYRDPDASGPVPVEGEALWSLYALYALSRVNDFLLLPFLANDAPATLAALRADFFASIGFERFDVHGGTPYSPFYHEIVSAIQTDVSHPSVLREVWPGLMFGALLFARAGVAVALPATGFDIFAAESSTLYFSYRRNGRRTEDQSFGWGGNSQWGTRFRRDYVDDDHFRLNVDGRVDLTTRTTFESSLEKLGAEAPDTVLPYGLRRELLINRHLVSQHPPRGEIYPYDDTLTMRKDATTP